MAHRKSFSVDRRVGIAMSALSPAQRAAVSRVIQSPQSFAAYASESSRVGTIKNPEQNLSTLRISPNLRLIFTKSADGVRVMDLVERATLNRFVEQALDKEHEAKPVGKKSRSQGPRVKAGVLAKKA